MKVALVTTPLEPGSPVARYVHALLPHLRERCELEVFVDAPRAGAPCAGRPARSVRELAPREHERLLFQIGDEPEHAFMLPLLATHGGIVALHSWRLADLARAAWPALTRGGLAARIAAWRQGGLAEARRLAAGDLEGRPLSLNRSVVRRADAFVVHDPDLRERILVERNAPTPVGVVPDPRERGGEEAWELAAEAYTQALERLPAHRVRRRSLIREAIDASDRARRERASASSGASTGPGNPG